VTRFASRAWFQALVLGAAGVALVRCSSESEVVFDDPSVSSAGEIGTAGFQLEVDSGLVFSQLIATLRFPDDTAQTKTIDISPDDSTITIYLGELPVGSGYEVTLAATSTTGAECSGTTKFKVKQDQTVVVNVRMECSGGIADPEVGAAQIKGEIIPATGDCPAVVERIEVAPSKAGIGVPITIVGAIGYAIAGWPHIAQLPPLSFGFVSVIGFVLMAPVSSYTTSYGVRLAHWLPRRQLEIGFGIFLLLVSVRFLATLV